MKIRDGFVSNSSSSSFVISKENITVKQLRLLENHNEVDKQQDLGCGCGDDLLNFSWSITENEFQVKGCVNMDNFNMNKFLSIIGVDPDNVVWQSS